jgi:4'-phosphopantetheinyl transferase EntD
MRAVAAVAPIDACAAIGVDVEEIDAHRAHALVRMSLSDEEIARVRATDSAMIAGPIALWCAREACVKAFALEVGWFGTALVAVRFDTCAPPVEGASRGWNVEIAFEAHPSMHAVAWESRDAIFAFAMRTGINA